MKAKRIMSAVLALVMMLGVMLTGVSVSALNFTDVEGHWAADAIEYVVAEGLMNGVEDGSRFAPDMSLTRGMVVTVLYRNDGSPDVEYEDTFLDVTGGKYYSEAAVWAYENGIVTGTGTNDWGEPYFSPDRNITRQELATMFVRYAAYKYVNTSADLADIDAYPDSADVASWAGDAVKWAVGVGLITGKSNGGKTTLSPLDRAMRAEFATIIKRYNNAEFKYNLVYNTPVLKGGYTEKEYPLVTDADIYVAVDGKDTNPGTLDKPIATFAKAVEMVRELKKSAKDEIKVAFKAGNYGSLTYRMTSADSGSAEVPITYCAYGDGEVTFSNGIEINGEDFVPLSDSEKEQFNSEAVENIYKVDISEYLADGTDLTGSIMFNSEVSCNVARYPDTNSLHNVTDKVDDTTAVFTMKVIKAQIDTFKNIEGAKATGYFRMEWLPETFIVTGYDKTTGQMTFDIGDSEGVGSEGAEDDNECDHVFYLHDFAYALDYEGEYWIDTEEKVLYAYAPKGNYLLAIDGEMLWLEGDTDYISFINLNFQGSTDSAFYAEFSDYITIDQCTFYGIGGDWAVGFSYTRSGCSDSGKNTKYVGSQHITFTNNEMSYLTGGGFRAYGSSRDHENACHQNLIDDGSLIENNSIHDYSILVLDATGISVTSFFGLDVRHNEIYNANRYAVDLNGQCRNMNFEYNVIHDCMLNSDDGGAFYNGRSHDSRGNVLRYNLFYNIPTGSGRYAIYFDDGMSGQEVYGNIFYNAGAVAVLMNGGRDNYIHDNLIIDTTGGRRALWTNDKYYGAAVEAVETNTDMHYSDFVSTYKSLPDINSELGKKWNSLWPEMYTMIYDYKQYEDPKCYITPVSEYENNYMINKPRNVKDYFVFDEPTLEFATISNNKAELSLDENDYFVDPTHGDYTMVDGADFMDIPFEKMGRY